MSPVPTPEPAGRATPETVPAALPELIACSRDRTLLALGGLLYKVYDQGNREDAAAEAAWGARLGGPGVLTYHGARTDRHTGRPCVVMDHLPRLNLAQQISRHGPLSPPLAARIARRLAATLSRFAELRDPDTPRGVVHRDVKPSNIVLDGEVGDPEVRPILLDLEHVRPAGALEPGVTFTGATHGFAPPEAYDGVPPDPSFDVFGLGACLETLLTGRPPFFAHEQARLEQAVRDGQRRRHRLLGQPPVLTTLIEACLGPAASRPSAAEIERTLAVALPEIDAESELDAVLARVQREDVEGAATALAALGDCGSGERRRQLERLIDRRRRLLARTSAPAELVPGADRALEIAGTLASGVPRWVRWLTRFPASERGLQATRRAISMYGDLMQRAPLAVAACKREADFESGEALLEATRAACLAMSEVPLGASKGSRESWRPTPMERDPLRFLDLAQRDQREAARSHRLLLQHLEAAETELDLSGAEEVLRSVADRYSGASKVASKLKDRIHRLGFYLDRISQPAPSLEHLREQLALSELAIDLAPVTTFQRRCGRLAAAHRLDSATRRNGLSALNRLLHDLVGEFPHCEPAAAAAIHALESATNRLTDVAWDLLADAHRKMSTEPIPVRPLQAIVNRLDTLRRLEAIVDRGERSRARLIDEHERLRLNVDQARTARDRLTRGAEVAMEQGHWTTALYDMERAVDRFTHDTSEAEVDQHLVEQLARARRQKEALDEAAAENMRLAAQYVDLQDDPNSDHLTRVSVLEKRRGVLQYLGQHLPTERSEPYRADLEEIELAIVQERTDRAEALLDATSTLPEQEQIIAEMVALLRPMVESGSRAGRRVQQKLDRWDRRLQRIREVRTTERPASGRRVTLAIAAIVVAGLAATAHQMGWLSNADATADVARSLAGELRAEFALTDTAAGPSFDSAEAYSGISRFAQILETAWGNQLGARRQTADAAARLVDAVRGIVNRGPDFELTTWAADFGDRVDSLNGSLTALASELANHPDRAELQRHLTRFGQHAVAAGMFTAAIDASEPTAKKVLATLLERVGRTGTVRMPVESRRALEPLLR